MYQSKCVMTILDQNGLVLSENNGLCKLPFGSEYKIRLRNKNDFTVKAVVTVDGRSLMSMSGGGIILYPNQKVDLERWIDSMTSGNKLKFVSVNHPQAQDPYSDMNGIIEVKFYKKRYNKVYIAGNKITPIEKPWNPWTPYEYPMVWYSNNDQTQYTSNVYTASVRGSCSSGEPGCTINGSVSDQQFTYEDMKFEDDAFCILSLKLTGLVNQNLNKTPHPHIISANFCFNCGKKRKNNDNFCSKCGTRL